MKYKNFIDLLKLKKGDELFFYSFHKIKEGSGISKILHVIIPSEATVVSTNDSFFGIEYKIKKDKYDIIYINSYDFINSYNFFDSIEECITEWNDRINSIIKHNEESFTKLMNNLNSKIIQL